MKVTLINFTADAMNLLIFAKNTRLNMTPELMDEITDRPYAKKLEEIKAISRTIKSSWEFLDVTFLVEGVTRATAQQITRTRYGTYAMQSQRVTDLRDVHVTNTIKDKESARLFDMTADNAKSAYDYLVTAGVPLEDARGILPINTQCNLLCKYNLRTLTDLAKSRRDSLRVQGEYVQVVTEMIDRVLCVWPWTAPFFLSDQKAAIEILEEVAKRLGITTGKGDGWEIAKAIDLLRN